MSYHLASESPESILRALGEALDHVDVGILLLNHNLSVRFLNSRQAEIFGLPSTLLAPGLTFRDLLDYAAANSRFAVADDDLPEYLDGREHAVRDGLVLPARINLSDGRVLWFSCVPCSDGGRILTYADISQELQREATDTAQLLDVEMRFRSETLEDQGAYLASLAEEAHQSRCDADNARLEVERRIARQLELEGELRRLATTDGLTGALNRAGFLTLARQSLERTEGKSYALLMLDVDHFKAINDHHGHAGGDVALQHLVATLRTGIRDVDLLGRLGGEEFAVMIPATSVEAAEVVAERLLSRVAGTSVMFCDKPIKMTISIGMAGQQAEDETIEQLARRADIALYQAKANGRNQIVRHQTADAG